MSTPLLQPIFGDDAWQKPAAVALWVFLVLVHLIVSIIAWDRGRNAERGKVGIAPDSGLEIWGNISGYPLVLTFSIGSLFILLIAGAVVGFIEMNHIKSIPNMLRSNDIQAIVSVTTNFLYQLFTGWLLSGIEGSESLTGMFQGKKNVAALIAGCLVSTQLAISLAALFFFAS